MLFFWLIFNWLRRKPFWKIGLACCLKEETRGLKLALLHISDVFFTKYFFIYLVRDVSIHLLSCESNSAVPKMQLRTFLKAEFFLVFCRPQKDLLHRVLQNLQNQIFACEAFSRQENCLLPSWEMKKPEDFFPRG